MREPSSSKCFSDAGGTVEKPKCGPNRLIQEVLFPETDIYSNKVRMQAVAKMRENPDADTLWEAIVAFQNYPFKTSKGLQFSYTVKTNKNGELGKEMFISRKEKSITRATVEAAYKKVLEFGGVVAGPKKLGCFGASYLYPVFERIGVLTKV